MEVALIAFIVRPRRAVVQSRPRNFLSARRRRGPGLAVVARTRQHAPLTTSGAGGNRGLMAIWCQETMSESEIEEVVAFAEEAMESAAAEMNVSILETSIGELK